MADERPRVMVVEISHVDQTPWWAVTSELGRLIAEKFETEKEARAWCKENGLKVVEKPPEPTPPPPEQEEETQP